MNKPSSNIQTLTTRGCISTVYGHRRVKCNYLLIKLLINAVRRLRFSVKPASGYTKEHRGIHAVTVTLEVLTKFHT